MTDGPGLPQLASAAIHAMQHETGVVIPVYLPEGVNTARGAALLDDTVAAYCTEIANPRLVCLSVDGQGYGADIASKIARTYGTSICISERNRGKLAAAANGVRALLENGDVRYVAVVDQDGDHFANELLNLVRVAKHIETERRDGRLIVLGRRSSRHRPMGFLRGELEEFADRVLLDALQYHAAMAGEPLRLEYALFLDEYPDFHSGYKFFDRQTARDVFASPPQMAGVSETCYYRHACEAVMTVESILSGAYLGVATRSTLNEQPITTFGLFDLSQLVADKIIWPCRRLQVPPHFVRQWMANYAPRLLLQTLIPEGKQEVERVVKLVMEGIAGGHEDAGKRLIQPLFV